jgi:site-specific DNA-methyltransferase (cytosine-N4-specific)
MSNSDYPKADNKKVLRPYSKSMKKLLEADKYNAGKRPSGHVISEKSFLTNNQGSIPHNIFELEQIDNNRELRLPHSMFSIANTKSNDFFTKTCKKRKIIPHPARMPLELASFFIEFLTEEGDIVLDPFGGSNTTGFSAEKLKRKWISIDTNKDYGLQSMIRFEEPSLDAKVRKEKKYDEHDAGN